MTLRKQLLLILFCCLAIGAGCLKTPPQFSLGAASSLVKVPYDKPFADSSSGRVELSAAGGEYESFQAVIYDVKQPLSSVKVELSPLSGESGTLGAENITVNPVGYIETTVASKQYPAKLGWWPDPLLDLQEFSVPAGEVQPVWVTICVPRGTKAGYYSGQLKVSAGEAGSRELEVRLRVRGIEIPQTPSIKTLTWVSGMENIYGYSKGSPEEKETLGRYYDFLLRNRLGPGGQLELEDSLLDHLISRGMNCFLLAIIPNLVRAHETSYSEQYKQELTRKLSDCVARFEPRGWLDGLAYVYNYDEVEQKHWPLAKEMYKLVKSVSPKLRVIQCLNIPEGVQALASYADTWDVYAAQYEQSGVVDRVKAGDEAWLAVCCYPATRPNVFLEYPAIDCRMLGWICWKTGVTGFEYWSPNHWGKNTSTPGLRGGWTANTFLNYNGDGYLLYPGKDGQPLGSVRLANLRDGFEDYEYLRLLDSLQGKAELPDSLVHSPTDYSSDPELLYKTREEIADRIEALTTVRH